MEISDSLVDLLIQIIHRIGVRAERKMNDLRRVSNKYGILFNMAQTAIQHPEGIIKDVLYPVVNEQTLKDLVKEFKHTGPAYREKSIRSSAPLELIKKYTHITIFDRNDRLICHLGEDQQAYKQEGWPNLPKPYYRANKFSSPHGICVDSQGSVYVAEWIFDGRVTKLTLA